MTISLGSLGSLGLPMHQGPPPPPPPTRNPNDPFCECCERGRATPYSHTSSNPPHFSWDYCQECYDAGCCGPGDCELWDEGEEEVVLGDCTVCLRKSVPLGTDGWCVDDLEKYMEYLRSNPIPPKDRFTPTWPGEVKEPAHQPAYLLPPSQWESIDFRPELLNNPKPRKKTHIMNQTKESPEDMMRRLIDERLGQSAGGPPSPAHDDDPVDLDLSDVLDAIDPRDSDSAMLLFNWLRDNSRLQKVATLDQGGYLFVYQEPEGTSRQGYIAGGTQGDRIVDDALSSAQASGGKPAKGLCRNCLSAVVKVGDGPIEAESPRPGASAKECSQSGGGPHEFAG